MAIIDGRKIAGEILDALKLRTKPEKFFGAALVGGDSASLSFLRQKEKAAKALGIDFRLYKLAADMTTDELRRKIGRLAGASTCGGFIVQLPLPGHINRRYVLNAVPAPKDVDVLSEPSRRAFAVGKNPILPPAVAAADEIMRRQGKRLSELSVAVIGAGFLVGGPIRVWLEPRIKKLHAFDEHTENLQDKLAEADFVISGAGSPKLFRAKHLKKGAVVIDFGSGLLDGRVAGDFDPEGSEAKDVAYTPTPGGTGPILVAKLFENFYTLNPSA